MDLQPLQRSPAPPTTHSDSSHELRLALAMRGGVSLAVWIGGACAEIDALRRSRACRLGGVQHREASVGQDGGAGAPPVRLYQWLLEAAGYEDVTVDVLSGASAGGLNGVLLSVSLAYGVRFEDMRQLWLEIADIEKLIRDPNDPKPPSVLQGDEYFQKRLEQQLQDLLRRADGTDVVERLDLHLAATLVEPVQVVVREDWSEPIVERRQAATFHFRKREDGGHFGNSSQERRALAAKLAVAARSSSSFPGAFEPARVAVTRPEWIGQPLDPTDPRNLFGIFSEAPRGDSLSHEFRVMDGGVLDNIPVERAIRSIGAMPAQGPTERWLLFLHPSPEVAKPLSPPAAGDKRADDGPDALQTTIKSLTTGLGRESLLDDVAVLRAHNEAALHYRMLRERLLKRLIGKDPTPAALFAAAKDHYGEYRAFRAELSARRIRQLIEDPVAVLGQDPFQVPAYRSPFDPPGEGDVAGGWTREQRTWLEGELCKAVRESLPPQMVAEPDAVDRLGVFPLRRLVEALLEVVREVEAASSTPGGGLGACKRDLYELRAAVDRATFHSDVFWPLYARDQPPPRGDPPPTRDVRDWATTALRRRDGLMEHLATSQTWHGVESEDKTIVERLGEKFGPPPRPSSEPRRQTGKTVPALWQLALDQVRRLADEAAQVEPKDLHDDACRMILEALKLLQGKDEQAQQRLAAMILAGLEVLLFSLDVTAPRDRQYIHFLRIHGDKETPLAEWFPGRQLRLDEKLAGNELGNFAAFYRSSWRANDWMWGRLDAARSLIDLLIQRDRIRLHLREDDLDLPGMSQDEKDAASTFLQDARPPYAGQVFYVHEDMSEDMSGKAAALEALVHTLYVAPLPAALNLNEDQRNRWAAFFQERWQRHEPNIREEMKSFFSRWGAPESLTVRDVLVERRHWELLLAELPTVVTEAVLGDVADGRMPAPRRVPVRHYFARLLGSWRTDCVGMGRLLREQSLARAVFAVRAGGHDPLGDPERVREVLGRYRVGQETIWDELGRDRFTRIAANLVVVVWNAFTHRLQLPGVLKAVGWLLRLLRLLALAVVQAPRWAVFLLLTIFFLGLIPVITNQDLFWPNQFTAALAAVLALRLLLAGRNLLWRLAVFLGLLAGALWAADRWGRPSSFTLALQWGEQRWEWAGATQVDLLILVVTVLVLATLLVILFVPKLRASWPLLLLVDLLLALLLVNRVQDLTERPWPWLVGAAVVLLTLLFLSPLWAWFRCRKLHEELEQFAGAGASAVDRGRRRHRDPVA